MSTQNTAALVLTTINTPNLLDGYYQNLKEHDHLDQCEIIVIPDKKTPNNVYDYCSQLSSKGLQISCPTLDEQEEFLRSLGKIGDLIPYNSDNRRNVGFLMALEKNVDFLISIDDDNHCLHDYDFFGDHEIVAKGKSEVDIVETNDEWFNICKLLNFESSDKIYPRGFPYYARHNNDGGTSFTTGESNIRLNQGLWLSDPDIDAITWLVSPSNVQSFTGDSLVLGDGTWSPINTQNTALHRDLITGYYFIPMGYPLAGVEIDRYGDIFSGYFVQKLAKEADDGVRFGSPIADHLRNTHNYLRDAHAEFAGLLVLENLVDWLVQADLDGNSYEEMYRSLSFQMEDAVETFDGPIWNDSTRGYFHRVGHSMRAWLDAVDVLT